MHPVLNQPGITPIMHWTSVGTLAGNEYYHITLMVRRQNGPVVRWMAYDTAGTEFTVPLRDLEFMRTPPQTAEVTWWVTVLAQPGEGWLPGGPGSPVSPDSESRIFLMLP